MKIFKSERPHEVHYLEVAFMSHFVDVPAIGLDGDGKPRGSVSQEFLLAGLIGLSQFSRFAVGVSKVAGSFSAQGIRIKDKDFLKYLNVTLGGYPGVKEVYFSPYDVGGVCYLVTISWDYDTRSRIRDALGAVYQTKSYRLIAEVVAQEDFYWGRLQEKSLNKYLEIRREIDPNAIELRFDVSDLPCLLGLRSGTLLESGVEAAFGWNGGISSAVYVREGFVSAEVDSYTQGSDRCLHQSIRLLNSACGANFREHKPKQALSRLGKDFPDADVYGLGSDVFEIVESVRTVISQPDELFRGMSAPAAFDGDRFALALRELIVNAFCHGRWDTSVYGRDDNDHKIADRVSIVHAGNRLEVINKLREGGLLRGDVGFKTASRRSALHNAFCDIGFSKGRSFGLKLVRQSLTKIGLASPIFVVQRGFFRALIPLSKSFSVWGYPARGCDLSKEEVGHLYVLWLTQFLGMVDQDVIASAFYIESSDAVRMLDGLVRKGLLAKDVHDISRFECGGQFHQVPTYQISDEVLVQNAIDSIVGKMNMVTAPGYLSIGALYQLSMRSHSPSPYPEYKDYIKVVYASEALKYANSELLACEHVALLREGGVIKDSIDAEWFQNIGTNAQILKWWGD